MPFRLVNEGTDFAKTVYQRVHRKEVGASIQCTFNTRFRGYLDFFVLFFHRFVVQVSEQGIDLC